MKRTWMIPALVALGALLCAGPALAQTALKSPQSVKTGLRIMNQVVGHTGRLIASRSYDIVPREGEELEAGAAVLREAIANEPAAFRSKVEPLIEKALEASSAMGAAAKAHDDAKLASTHDQFAAAVKSLIEQFPEDLRPKRAAAKPGGGAPPRS